MKYFLLFEPLEVDLKMLPTPPPTHPPTWEELPASLSFYPPLFFLSC